MEEHAVGRPAERDHHTTWDATQSYPAGSTAAARVEQLILEYAFLLPVVIDASTLRQVVQEAVHLGVPPHRVLMLAGKITVARYLELLQTEVALHAPHSPLAVTEVVDGLSATPGVIAVAAAAIRA